jgi:hypothetical protein
MGRSGAPARPRRRSSLEILGDGLRHECPELNTEHDREKQHPVSARLPAAVQLTHHRARTLQRTRDGSVVNRYFVFHANVKKGTAKTTLAPTIQTHMPQPPVPDSPEPLTLASGRRLRHHGGSPAIS